MANRIVKSDFPDIFIPDNISCAQFFFRKWNDYGNRIALIDSTNGKRYTYGATKRLCVRLASGLWRRGIRKGDVICVVAPNTPEYVIIFLAVTAIGAILTDVNPIYTSDEIVRQLKDCSATYYITLSSQLNKVKEVVKGYSHFKDIIVIGDEIAGYTSFTNLLAKGIDSLPNVDICGHDVALLPYSSGTTGLPKGVRLSHFNVIANTLQICQSWSPIFFGEGPQIVLGQQPFFHASGKIVTLCNTLYSGGTVVVIPQFNYHKYLQLIRQYKVTALLAPPPLLLRMSKDPDLDKYDLSSVKTIGVGSAPVPLPVVHALKQRLGISEIRIGYGMTEGTCVTTSQPAVNRKYGSVGKLLSNTEAKIVDLKTGQDLGVGENGELHMRGPQVMRGYLNKPEATLETIDNAGWLHTGDIGYYDEDRHFYIVDRVKELIKVKGFQVAPAELESVLLSHQAVSDAAVIGISDERAGELPKAFVVLKENSHVSPRALEEYCAGKLAPYKRLRGGVELVNEIPKSQSGKILRKVLKMKLQKSKL